MVEQNEVNLKVFNTAKVFAEQVLFPLMFDFKKFQRQADFGTEKLEEAVNMSEEIRDIMRVNGLKAMAETCLNLLKAISSTVLLSKKKEEITEMELITKRLDDLILKFYQNRDEFFYKEFRGKGVVEVLDRKRFNEVRNIIDICYINTEILMTRNKLLFSDASDDFKDDKEIMQQIKEEYVGE